MSVNEEIKNINEKYRSKFDGKYVAFDGLVDESEYINSNVRTVFLLKEVNEDRRDSTPKDEVCKLETEDWDYVRNIRDDVKEGCLYPRTYPNMLLWTELLEKDCEINFKEYENKVKEIASNILKIGIVNIKKTSGGGTSKKDNMDFIKKAVEDYHELIIEEIDAIRPKPQIVVCGGTFSYAREIFGISRNYGKLNTGTEYFIRNGILFLEFPHPGWFSVDRKIFFAYAKELLKEALGLVAK